MDSQFIKYMTKNCLNVELWSPQGTATVLLGKGQIWLNDILNRSVKNISAIVRGKCPIYQPNNSLIANIEYRMRMRLPIGPYL